MAVTFVNANTGTGANSNAVTVTCPTGTRTGDLLLLFAGNGIATDYTANPTGFTKITSPAAHSADLGSCCWYKFATSSDIAGSTTYTATAGTGTGASSVGTILAYRWVDSTQFPLAATKYGLIQTTTASTTPFNSPAPTNPSSIGATDLLVRAYIAGEDTSSGAPSMGAAPSGWSSRASVATNTTGYDPGMVVCDGGPADSATITDGEASMWDVYTLALPAAALPASNGTITYVGSSLPTTPAALNSAAGTQIVIPPPSGINAGDVLILMATNNFPDTFADPSGWTLLDSNGGIAGDIAYYTWWKQAGASETSVTLNHTNASANGAIMLAYRGVDTAGTVGGPIGSHKLTATTTAATSPTVAAVSAVNTHDVVVAGYLYTPSDTSSPTVTAASGGGWTVRNTWGTTNGSAAHQLWMDALDVTGSGAVPPTNASCATTGVWGYQTVQLIPAPAPPAPPWVVCQAVKRASFR